MTAFRFDPSLNSFFNALLREWQGWCYRPVESSSMALTGQLTTTGTELAGWFEIPGEDGMLSVPCRHFSHCGRHQLMGPCRLWCEYAGEQEVSFTEAATWVILKTALARETEAVAAARFLTRVRQSDRNLRAALEHRQEDLDHLFSDTLTFAEAEGALLSGHSIHPCPKARDHFSDEDAHSYAPEYGQPFVLHWYLVKTSNLYFRHVPGVDYESLIAGLLHQDPRISLWAEQLEEDERLLPCHPFQHAVWQQSARIRELQQQGRLVHLGRGEIPWTATSSLRAIYSPLSDWMLKFSLSVRLTNSLRHLQPEELVRGAELGRVLKTPPAEEFSARFPQFSILQEPAAAALCGDDGRPFEESIVLWRENPFKYFNPQTERATAPGQQTDAETCAEVLATLLQDDPRSGESRLSRLLWRVSCDERDYADRALSWFRGYLNIVVDPLLTAQADYGLLFGAHQQNIVLEQQDGLPVRAWFRDCQGTGYTALAEQLYRPHIPGLAGDSGNLIDDQLAIRLFSYYLFVNATFNVISSLAQGGAVSEHILCAELGRFLQRVRARGVRDPQCIDYLLSAETLSAKGNFFVSLRHLNENTETDYLAMYHPFANPLIEAMGGQPVYPVRLCPDCESAPDESLLNRTVA